MARSEATYRISELFLKREKLLDQLDGLEQELQEAIGESLGDSRARREDFEARLRSRSEHRQSPSNLTGGPVFRHRRRREGPRATEIVQKHITEIMETAEEGLEIASLLTSLYQRRKEGTFTTRAKSLSGPISNALKEMQQKNEIVRKPGERRKFILPKFLGGNNSAESVEPNPPI